MKLRVKYSAQLRTALERSEDHVVLPESSALADLLLHLAGQHDAARPHLVSVRGQLHGSLLIVVNNAAVPVCQAASWQLNDGDTILLLPPIAGG